MDAERPAYQFADVYDDARQPQLLGKHAPAGQTDAAFQRAFMAYLGRLRLDAVLNRKIVLRDANVWDGAFFLHAATQRDTDGSLLLNRIPFGQIEIQSAAANMEEAILSSFLKPALQNPSQYGLYLSGLPKDVAGHVATSAGPALARGATSIRDLFRILHDFLPENEDLERFEEGVVRILESSIQTTQRVDFPDWSQQLTAKLQESDALLTSALSTEGQGRLSELMYEISPQIGRRSLVYRGIDKLYGQDDPETRTDRATVRTWYDHAYNGLSAINHRCGVVELNGEIDSRPMTPVDGYFDRLRGAIEEGRSIDLPASLKVELPAGLLLSLAELNPQTFDRFLEDHQIQLENWHESGAVEDLKAPVESFVNAVDSSVGLSDLGLVPDGIWSGLKLVVNPTAAATAAVVGVLLAADPLTIGASAFAATAMTDKVIKASDRLGSKSIARRSIIRRAKALRSDRSRR